MKNKKIKRLVVSAVMIALASVLSMIKIPLPFGGGVTIVSMMPVILLGYLYGVKWGFLTAGTYSLCQVILGYSTIAKYVLPGEDQMQLPLVLLMVFLDYILAYTALGFGSLFRNKKPFKALVAGSLVATLLRYLCHIVSGAILWGEWAEWFFTDEIGGTFGEWILGTFNGNSLAWIYSVIYNGLYMIPEIILTAIVAGIISAIPAITNKKE